MLARWQALREVPGAGSADAGSGNRLTIDDLARAVGLSVRNVRSHQARGLLPPPEVRGRIGYYGPEHVAGLRLIQELQGEGMKLDGHQAAAGASPQGRGEGLLRVKARSRRPRRRRGARGRLGRGARRAAPGQRGRREGSSTRRSSSACSCRSARTSTRCRARACCWSPRSSCSRASPCAPRSRSSRTCAATRARCPQRFVKLFIDEVWKPFVDAGMPEEQWSEIAEAIESCAAARRRGGARGLPTRR